MFKYKEDRSPSGGVSPLRTNNKGVISLSLALILSAIIVTTVALIATTVFREIKAGEEIKNTAIAFHLAETAIEKARHRALNGICEFIYPPLICLEPGKHFCFWFGVELIGDTCAITAHGSFRGISRTINTSVPIRGVVGYWTFDENANDLSLFKNHGTMYNFPANPWVDRALKFDGMNDFVRIDNSPSLNPTHITVEAWAKSNTPTWNTRGMLVSKRNVYILYPITGTRDIRFWIFLDGIGWRNSTFVAPPIDITQWNHFVGTWDGSAIKIYVNGESRTTSITGSINTADTGNLYIGWDDGLAGRFFNGLIDEVRIYNRALTSAEVSARFALGR